MKKGDTQMTTKRITKKRLKQAVIKNGIYLISIKNAKRCLKEELRLHNAIELNGIPSLGEFAHNKYYYVLKTANVGKS